MIRRPPRSTRTDTLFPYTTLFRSTSIRTGTVTASAMLRKLCAYPRQNGLALALREVGRLERSIFMRSEEHTSELQSLMRISYAVFCLKKKKKNNTTTKNTHNKRTTNI